MSNKRDKRVLWVFVLLLVFCCVSLTACQKGDIAVSNPLTTDAQGNNNPEVSGENGGIGGDTETNTPVPVEVIKEDIKVKALYLTGWTVGIDEKLQHYVELAKNTEINSYVVDIKDDDGYVGYESNLQEVRDIGAWKNKYNADKVLKEFHDNDVHVIGRLVCFKDPILSSKKPELAVKHVNGGLWKEKVDGGKTVSWLNPYNKEAWTYLIDIAKEAVEKGFDEIQFDYVRFPNGSKNVMNFGSQTKEKNEAINEFLAYARAEMPYVIISADVFGIICESPEDTEGIGQYLERIGMDIDYLSPMVYPSHYAVGQKVNGVQFMKPDFEPYGVVYNTLFKAKDRISKVEGYRADMRAYLQDFTASWLGKGYYQTYGPEQVKEQIKAVYDAGFEEWIFWSAGNKYSESAFLKEED